MSNPILVGMLDDESLTLFQSILSLPPCRLFNVPMMYLSSPFESVQPDMLKAFEEAEAQLTVQGRPQIFRNVYNQRLGLSTFLAGVQLDHVQYGDTSKFRQSVLGVNVQGGFIPYFDIIPDGMQSRAVRAFSNMIQNSLVKYDFTFRVLVAHPENPQHEYLFKAFNPLATEILASTYQFI